MSTDPMNYHQPIEPTQAAHPNPYEPTSPYGEIPSPPPPPQRSARSGKVLAAILTVLVLMFFSGMIGFVVHAAPSSPPALRIDVGATATSAWQSGYNDGKSSTQTGFNTQATAIATTSYGNGQNDERKHIIDFYQQKCTKDANGYAQMKFYQNSSGQWLLTCY